MNALRDVSKVWLVAKMVHTLFESILGNKAFEERLQKAAGRRHTKNKRENGLKVKEMQPAETTNETSKRKFDDMEFGYSNGPPAPQVSYERSRPQSPAMTPSRDLGQAQSQHIPRISARSPSAGQNAENLLGASRPDTRPTTPFNPLSYPSTPPDLFLHTRNSPKISEDLWQNYQPDQLFPQDANGMFPLQSPNQSMVDPALRAADQSFTPQGMQQQASPGAMHQMSASDGIPQMYSQDPNAWAQIQAMGGSGPRSDDVWSNSSMSGPTVPMALNVGDWFEFFGIPNAEMGALNGGLGTYS